MNLRDRLCCRERLTGLYALLLLSAFLLYVPASGYSRIVEPKQRVFQFGTAAFLVLYFVLCLWERPRLPKGTRLSFGLCVTLLGLYLLSSLLSPYQDTVWLGSRRGEGFVTLCLYLLIVMTMLTGVKLGRLHVWAAAVTAGLMLLVAVLQFWGGNPLGLYPGEYTYHDRGLLYSGEYLSTIGNVDLLSAAVTVLCLFLMGAYAANGHPAAFFGGLCAWSLLLLSEVTAGPVAVLGCLALCFPVCLAKGVGVSRMGELLGLLALGFLLKRSLGYAYEEGNLRLWLHWDRLSWLMVSGLGVCGLAALLLHHFPRKPHPGLAWAVVCVYLLLALAVVVYLWGYRGENETLAGLSQLLHGNPPDTLGSSRIRIWREALELGRQKPILGSGPDTYHLRSNIVFTKELPDGSVRQTSVDVAHCEYLNLWVHTGLPSMAVFVSLILSGVLPALRRLRPENLPLVLPVAGYGIHALFGISQSLCSPLFYLFLGALCCTNAIDYRKESFS